MSEQIIYFDLKNKNIVKLNKRPYNRNRINLN